jgi:hypothetical protein
MRTGWERGCQVVGLYALYTDCKRICGVGKHERLIARLVIGKLGVGLVGGSRFETEIMLFLS